MGYLYRRSLTVDPTKCGASDSSGFTVLVSLTDTTLKTVSNGGHVQNANGYDIVFTSDIVGTTLLNWEVESYDSTNGILVAWVKLPTVSHTVNTVFYMFYGNSSISTFQGGATGTAWDANYLGIYHLSGAGPSVLSSTGSNNGTNQGVTATAGQIDGGGGFVAASSQYVDCGTGMNPTAITYGCWVNPNASGATNYKIMARDNVGNTVYCTLELTSGKVFAWIKTVSGTPSDSPGGTHTLSNGTWYHVMVTYNSTAGLVVYVNGAVDGTAAATGAINTTAVTFAIGRAGAGSSAYFNGSLDEVRISQIARSANWILTEYNNQIESGHVYEFGGGNSCGTSARERWKWALRILKPRNSVTVRCDYSLTTRTAAMDSSTLHDDIRDIRTIAA